MDHENGAVGAAAAAVGFDAQACFDSAGVAQKSASYGLGETICVQGDIGDDVLFVQSGGVRLSVISKTAQQAVVAILGPGAFFGEGCLTDRPIRPATATAITPTVIVPIAKDTMLRLLREEHAMSTRFITYILARDTRVGEDLIDQLFNSSEKRLARTLLLLARYRKQPRPSREVPTITQTTLSEIVGTTRSRVNDVLNRFKNLGFIEYNDDGELTINSALLSVVMGD